MGSLIAHDYQNQYQTWDGRFDQAAQVAVANGSSPKLALAIASQYNASYHGNPIDNNAPGPVNSVAKGIQGLQQKVNSDISAYSNQCRPHRSRGAQQRRPPGNRQGATAVRIIGATATEARGQTPRCL